MEKGYAAVSWGLVRRGSGAEMCLILRGAAVPAAL